jgi:hypothetical protein
VALLKAFEAYIKATEIPVEAEFAYQHDIDKRRLYDWPEFEHALALFRCKKEGALELKSLYCKINPRMAIFALKQLGWTDRGEQTLRGDKGASPITFEVSEKVLERA